MKREATKSRLGVRNLGPYSPNNDPAPKYHWRQMCRRYVSKWRNL